MELDRFTSEVVPLGKKLYRFALSYLKEQAEAEDAVQEVMIRLWDRRETLDNYQSVEAFAMTVTRNHCLDRLRKKKPLSFEEVPVLEKELHREGNPQQRMEVSDVVNKIQMIMRELPGQQREIVQLRDVEGYAFEEIADITGLNVNLIRVNLSRARKKIRETLIKWNRYGMESNQKPAGEILRG